VLESCQLALDLFCSQVMHVGGRARLLCDALQDEPNEHALHI
jgi:hypothetical protein